jgi:hypothetical protein
VHRARLLSRAASGHAAARGRAAALVRRANRDEEPGSRAIQARDSPQSRVGRAEEPTARTNGPDLVSFARLTRTVPGSTRTVPG